MQLHNLKLKNKRKAKKRIGRGGKRGTYSGKGMKGQKSRTGNSTRPQMRDIIKKIPKKRGYNHSSIKVAHRVVNLFEIQKSGLSGNITPKILVEAGLVNKIGGKLPKVKILGTGEINKKITIEGCEVSTTALKKIQQIKE